MEKKSILTNESVQNQKSSNQLQTMKLLMDIWIYPRATIRKILDSNPNHLVHILAIIGGIEGLLSSAYLGSHIVLTIPGFFIRCFFFGPIIGIFQLYVLGFLYAWTGRILNGKGKSNEMRTAYAWAHVPSIPLFLLWIIQFTIFGQDIWLKTFLFWVMVDRYFINPLKIFLFLAFLGIQFMLFIWTIVLLLKCLAEAHRFSTLRSIGTVFLTFTFLILIVGLSLLIFYIMGKSLGTLIILILVIGFFIWKKRRLRLEKTLTANEISNSIYQSEIQPLTYDTTSTKKIKIISTKQMDVGKGEQQVEKEISDQILRNLARQYAVGEITREEYERLKKILEDVIWK